MNIFICQTPFQLFYAYELINYLTKRSENKRFLIIHSSLKVNTKNTKNIDYIRVDNTAKLVKSFFQLKKVIGALKEIVKENQSDVSIFIPHIGGLLANYIYFNNKFRKTFKCEVNFFYEGVLYFYDYKERFKKYHFKRIAISLFLGFLYRYKETILPYESDKISYIYTPLRKFTKGKERKKIEVQFNNSGSSFGKENFLILGGPVSYLKEFYNASIQEITTMKKENNIIYYKGHASFNTHNPYYKEVFSEYMKELDLGYEELDSNMPIELLIEKVKPFKIFSYYSSALLNIKLIYKDEIDVVCYLNSKEEVSSNILDVFEHYDIDIIRI
ncbi:hypothetical protein [Snuella lapsa]|uniref:Uncharacterized protein n=1 Tax=Snuella lapsa TaxID=870481 RepID=A0ABP6XFD6_9FLAO